jgi:hypothetical protein
MLQSDAKQTVEAFVCTSDTKFLLKVFFVEKILIDR